MKLTLAPTCYFQLSNDNCAILNDNGTFELLEAYRIGDLRKEDQIDLKSNFSVKLLAKKYLFLSSEVLSLLSEQFIAKIHNGLKI